MPPATRPRPQWCLKGKEVTLELRQLVAKAAQQQGLGITQWVAIVLRERAQAVLKGESDTQGALPVVTTQRLDTLEERLAAIEARLRPWWQRWRRR